MKKGFLGYVLGTAAVLALFTGTAFAQTADCSNTAADACTGGQICQQDATLGTYTCVTPKALTSDQLFGGGGTGTNGSTFANTAGLSQGNLVTTISAIIRTVLGFLGIVAVVIILFGGFQFMTAGGNPDKVKHAKTLMIQGLIGLVIILLAFAIAQFVIGSLTSAVNG